MTSDVTANMLNLALSSINQSISPYSGYKSMFHCRVWSNLQRYRLSAARGLRHGVRELLVQSTGERELRALPDLQEEH